MRSPFTITRQATSQATSRPAGIATYHHEITPNAATPVTAAVASRIRASTLRRRLVARFAAARRAAGLTIGRSCSATGLRLRATVASAAGRPGVTTRRALRRSTGSRRASTRIDFEKRSTERLRTSSSW